MVVVAVAVARARCRWLALKKGKLFGTYDDYDYYFHVIMQAQPRFLGILIQTTTEAALARVPPAN